MRLLFTSILLIIVFTSFSQSVANTGGVTYLYKNEAEGEEPIDKGYYIGPHVLGDTITMLLNKFESEYTYYEQVQGAYSSKELKVIKKDIYRAVKKVNKYYEKLVKKDKIRAEVAYIQLKKVLQIGIKLKNFQTREVESTLAKLKSAEEIEKYLVNLQFKNG